MTNPGLLATQIGDLLGRSNDAGVLALQRSGPWAPEQLAGNLQPGPFAELFQSQKLAGAVSADHESTSPGDPEWIHNLLISEDLPATPMEASQPLAQSLPALAEAQPPGLAKLLTALPVTPATEALPTPDPALPGAVPAGTDEGRGPSVDGGSAALRVLPERQPTLPSAGNLLPLAGKDLPLPAAPAAGTAPQPAAEAATAFAAVGIPATNLAADLHPDAQRGREPAQLTNPVKADPGVFTGTRTAANNPGALPTAAPPTTAATTAATTTTTVASLASATAQASAETGVLSDAPGATTTGTPPAAIRSAPAQNPSAALADSPTAAATRPETGLPDIAGPTLRGASENVQPEVLRPAQRGLSTAPPAPQLTPVADTVQRRDAQTITVAAPETPMLTRRPGPGSGPATPGGRQPAIAGPDADLRPVQSAAPTDPLAVSANVAAIAGRDGAPSPAATATTAQPAQIDAQPAAAYRQTELTSDPKATSQHLTRQISVLARDGVQTARVQLYPEHLGQVDVRIRIDDDGAFINLHAHTAHGRDALDASLHRLRDMCAEQGLNLSDANVTFGDERTSQQSFRDRAAASGHGRSWIDSSGEAEQNLDQPARRQAPDRLVDVLA